MATAAVTPTHMDVCDDANVTSFDLDACYDALDAYYEDAASPTPVGDKRSPALSFELDKKSR